MIKLKIKEAMDSSIPSWLRPRLEKGKVPTQFLNRVDLANTVYHKLPVPRTPQEFNKIRKDPNQVTVTRLEDEKGDTLVWLAGYNDGAEFAPSGSWSDRKPISRHAAKNIIPYIIDYGYLDLGDSDWNKLRQDRRANRPEDRAKTAQYLSKSHEPDYEFGYDEEGKWARIYQQGPTMQTWKTKSGYDKSGYRITGIEKYKTMLANMGLDNYDRTMDRIYDSYEALAGMIRLCRGSKYKMETYRSLIDRIVHRLEDVEREYSDYTNTRDRGNEDGYSSGYAEKYIKPRVTSYLKYLRGYSKKADEFISHLTADDWTDEDFRRFSWNL